MTDKIKIKSEYSNGNCYENIYLLYNNKRILETGELVDKDESRDVLIQKILTIHNKIKDRKNLSIYSDWIYLFKKDVDVLELIKKLYEETSSYYYNNEEAW
jgi:hypothetical protein